MAEKLAYKKYIELRLNDLYRQKRELQKQIQAFEPDTKYVDFISEPAYVELLASVRPFQTNDKWANEDYIKCPYHPEHLIHHTIDNLVVRSKSEALIAIALMEHNIPFRYECKYENAEYEIYPDFTIRNSQGHLLYWEHFGIMDSEEYQKSFSWKMIHYPQIGLFPGKNLIMTFETSSEPLSFYEIQKTIQLNIL